VVFEPSAGKSIMNDDWITENGVPDPEVLPEIPGYHVLVRPLSIRRKTKGGILMPDKFRDDIQYLTTVGKVIKVGSLAYKDPNKFPEGNWCEEGNYVCYGKHTGQKFMYKGIRYLLIYDDQVIMKIENPSDVDPMFTLAA
jgi:co-chaperonin GroES (HSP10)